MIIRNRKKLSKYSHSVRFNQIVAPSGVGAMVDFPEQTLMVASTDYWHMTTTIRDQRLEKVLNVQCFKLPPTADKARGIPMVRFPEWYFCPRCKSFKHIKEWEKEYIIPKNSDVDFMVTPKCMDCKVQLVPAGIITICEHGHISDFPWVNWLHDKSGKTLCSDPQIKFASSTSTLGLEGLQLECTTCKAKASMKGAFNDSTFERLGHKYLCSGKRPWDGTKEKCSVYPKAAQRGGLNVYFPKVVSSLVIPPYSEELYLEVEASEQYKALKSNLNNEIIVNAVGRDKLIESFIKSITDEIGRNKEVVEGIIKREFNSSGEETTYSKEFYRQEEYNALIGNIPREFMNTRDFKIEKQDAKEYNMQEVKSVVLVKKLREVRALIGFSRINPPENSIFVEDESNLTGVKTVDIKSSTIDWYPAQETRGEGIFIEFDDDTINKWIKSNPEVSHNAALLEKRYNNKSKNKDYYRKITPKFILLHTISHLLIKELSFQCGYNSASLSERIFCNTEDDSIIMSGILIYTASGDSEGSLGGLVRQGKSDMLPQIFRNAVRRAKWCSSDPVCIESNSQGRDGLNLSACHACALVAETTCEEFNVLLDRKFVVGNISNSIKGFFNNYL